MMKAAESTIAAATRPTENKWDNTAGASFTIDA